MVSPHPEDLFRHQLLMGGKWMEAVAYLAVKDPEGMQEHLRRIIFAAPDCRRVSGMQIPLHFPLRYAIMQAENA